MSTSNKVFSLFSFIGFVLCCIPFARHLQAWNTGTCLIMVWNGLACLVYFANSIVWNDNINNPAPVWCDISSRIGIAVAIGIPTGILCINRRLYLIITGKPIVTKAEKRRAVIFDLALGLGIPVIDLILMFIPQDSRFMIYEDLGCSSSISNTTVGTLLGIVPQLLIGLVCTVYSILTVYLLHKKRVGLRELLSSDNNITTGGYLRLLTIAIIGSACLVPLGLWSLISGLLNALPWQGWAYTHARLSYVTIIPASIWRSDQRWLTGLEITRWQFVFSAVIFFALFGFHEEARASYRSAVRRLIARVPCIRNVKPSHDRETGIAPGVLPLVFASNPTRPKKFLDFSTNLTKVLVNIGGDLSRTQSSFPFTISSGSVAISREVRSTENYEAGQPTSGPAHSESQPIVVPPAVIARSGSPSHPTTV